MEVAYKWVSGKYPHFSAFFFCVVNFSLFSAQGVAYEWGCLYMKVEWKITKSCL